MQAEFAHAAHVSMLGELAASIAHEVSTVTEDAAMLCCSVEGNGPGIAGEHAGRLFERFFTTKESGMSMGLSICRSIVEAHGGRIGAERSAAHGGALLVHPADIRRDGLATIRSSRGCFNYSAPAERTRRIGTPLYEGVKLTGSRAYSGTSGLVSG